MVRVPKGRITRVTFLTGQVQVPTSKLIASAASYSQNRPGMPGPISLPILPNCYTTSDNEQSYYLFV